MNVIQLPKLQQPCQNLNGVGPALAKKLEKLNIFTIQDLLFHLPSRYQNRTQLTPINQLRFGDYAVIKGRVIQTQIIRKQKNTYLVNVDDGSGIVQLRFFHFLNNHQKNLSVDNEIICFGEVRKYGMQLCIIHPEYQFSETPIEPLLDDKLTAIYPSIESLTQKTLRKIILQALNYLEQLTELLPDAILQAYQLTSIQQCLAYIHKPPSKANVDLLMQNRHPYQKRLALEELVAHQLNKQLSRQNFQSLPAMALPCEPNYLKKFLQQLPFPLTSAQQRVIAEIHDDLNQDKPMLRLVQGDVGSGKTLVAACASLPALFAKQQVAIMAPTEILAEQHLQSFSRWFAPYNIKLAFLSGQIKAAQRKQVLTEIAQNQAQIIIGTHALFQKEVCFAKLSLVIIDEQHRFGVHQRLLLNEKGSSAQQVPHQLIMTATPIPRTLAMTSYANLNHSIIDELPPGRQAITTVVLNNNKREAIIERIKFACEQGRQVYWVCTLITESEQLQCQTAEDTWQQLRMLFPQYHIGLVHGQLNSEAKDKVIQQFRKGSIQILVATTVIEVGVDVPNASLMIIENAERLGLSQLHQLRGRIGRGTEASHCVLLYQTPLSHHAKQRLNIMRSSQDGFLIAQKDLELRGPGELLGTKQSGDLDFKIADIRRDQSLITDAHKIAQSIDTQTARYLIQRWAKAKNNYSGV